MIKRKSNVDVARVDREPQSPVYCAPEEEPGAPADHERKNEELQHAAAALFCRSSFVGVHQPVRS